MPGQVSGGVTVGGIDIVVVSGASASALWRTAILGWCEELDRLGNGMIWDKQKDHIASGARRPTGVLWGGGGGGWGAMLAAWSPRGLSKF